MMKHSLPSSVEWTWVCLKCAADKPAWNLPPNDTETLFKSESGNVTDESLRAGSHSVQECSRVWLWRFIVNKVGMWVIICEFLHDEGLLHPLLTSIRAPLLSALCHAAPRGPRPLIILGLITDCRPLLPGLHHFRATVAKLQLMSRNPVGQSTAALHHHAEVTASQSDSYSAAFVWRTV